MKLKLSILFASAVLFAFSSSLNASLISWGTSSVIDDGGAFVDSTGTLVAAINADNDDDNATFGGVTWVGHDVGNWNAGIAGLGGVTISSNAPNGNYGTTFVQGGGPPPGITDSNINNLIGSGIWNPQSVTMTGLTIGDIYRIQIISNDSRNGRHSDFVAVLTDGVNGVATGANGFNSLSDTAPGAGDPALPGHSIIGTFTADATTQSFNIFGSTNGGASTNSGGRAQINGFQLRTLPPPVPEPSSALLIGLTGAACCLLRRRS